MNPTLTDISGWNERYVCGLPAGEFDWLDFKDSRWLDLSKDCLDKLSKYASAFANFDGGYLIVGVNNPQPGQPIQIDGGVRLDIKPDLKGWIEDILPNLVDPPLQRLNVHLITHSAGSPIHPDCALVIIHIPASQAAPHQASDHKYYTRIGSKLSPIGHQSVLDILNRKKTPTVKTEVIINFHSSDNKPYVLWKVTNQSDVFARYVQSRITIPSVLEGFQVSFDDSTQLFAADGKPAGWLLVGSNTLKSPLFPRGTVGQRFKFRLVRADLSDPVPPHISFTTFADHMPPVKGTIEIEKAIRK